MRRKRGEGALGEQPQRPKRRNTVLVVAATTALLLIGLSAAGYAAWLAYRRAAVQSRVELTEAHLADVAAHVAAAEKTIAAVDLAEPAEAKRALAGADSELDAVDKDLALAREDANVIPRPLVAQAYAHGLRDADSAVRSAREAIAFADDVADIERLAHEGLQKANAATDLLTAAIAEGNREEYRSQETKAGQANALFAEAEQLFEEAARIDASADLGEAAAWARRSREEADAVREQAVAGSSGDTATYNRLVGTVNALTKEVNSMEHPRALTDEHWADAKLAKMLGAVRTHAEDTRRALERARGAADGR